MALHRLDRPATALLSALAGAELGVVVDAARAEGPPGAVVQVTDPAQLGPGQPLSSHGLGVAEALALGRTLGELPPRLVLLGVVVAAGGASLAPAAVAGAARVVAAEVDGFLAAHPGGA